MTDNFRKFTKEEFDAYTGFFVSHDKKFPVIADCGNYSIVVDTLNTKTRPETYVSVIKHMAPDKYKCFSNSDEAMKVAKIMKGLYQKHGESALLGYIEDWDTIY